MEGYVNTIQQGLDDQNSDTADNKELLELKSKSKLYYFLKRCFDIVASILGLICLSPLFLIVAIAIRLESEGKAIYKQERCGKNGKLFKMYKFRSMCDNAHSQREDLEELNERDGPVFKITNDPRITKVGKFIRKTCIDELPQLLNVLKGEMSVVGPRPPLQSEVDVYTAYDMQRLKVVPGLTCYWQVNKGEETTFYEWVEMDLQYIQNQSIITDIMIIISTFGVLFLGKGDN